MNMKWFAIVGTILFLGVIFAPSVNAGVVKDAINEMYS